MQKRAFFIFLLFLMLFGTQVLASDGVNINVNINDRLHDNNNYAGLASDATDGYDSGIDIPEPMNPPSDYLSVYFPHTDWTSLFDNYMRDIRNGNDDLSNSVKTYELLVKTDQLGETVELDFTIDGTFPASYGIVFQDTSASQILNLRESSSYSFNASSSQRVLFLHLGDSSSPEVSLSFPDEGALLDASTEYNVLWNTSDISDIRWTKLHYSLDNGGNWTYIDSLSGENSSYGWTTPSTFSIEAKIKIEAMDWAGNSQSYVSPYSFIIDDGTAPVISLTYPENGTIFDINAAEDLLWTLEDASGID